MSDDAADLTPAPTVATEKSHDPVFNPNPHQEKHAKHGAVVRDAIIGFADGLTVPFALTASLSSIGSSRIVIIGGLAELFAGSISMGLGGYLAEITEREHYESEEAREKREVIDCPEEEEQEIYEIFGDYGLERDHIKPLVEGLKKDHDAWVKFMMNFELQLPRPDTSRAWMSAIVMGISYLLGGLVPMIPYFAIRNVNHALFTSIGITIVILLVFGYVKAIITGTNKRSTVWSAFQTLIIGAVAAGTSYGIVRAVDNIHIA